MRVINLTWPMEIEQWDDFSWMKVANLRNQAGKRAFLQGSAHIYLCNFEGIPNLVTLIESKKTLPYDTLVIDESTKIKNHSAKRPNAYRRVVPHEKHKRIWALTGTPAPNSLMDLFAQTRFVDGGVRLGRSFSLFQQTYFSPSGYNNYVWQEKPHAQEAIQNRLSDITLTLRSKDWLDIPDTEVIDIEVPLSKDGLSKYKEFEEELILEVASGEEITASNAAVLVGKLLQFTSGAVYDTESVWHDVHPLKIKALELIMQKAGEPVLVACAFKHEQERMRKAFPKAHFFADAKTESAQKELLRKWNAKEIPMLVAHPKSVGHGLNLQHGGRTLVWFTLTFSREDYEQMIARLSRRGQEDIVRVYRLMCTNTVDYAVATVIEEKKSTEDRLLKALKLLESYRASKGKKVNKLIREEDFC
jgi:SNF2 family DNA or RNA helicase